MPRSFSLHKNYLICADVAGGIPHNHAIGLCVSVSVVRLRDDVVLISNIDRFSIKPRAYTYAQRVGHKCENEAILIFFVLVVLLMVPRWTLETDG